MEKYPYYERKIQYYETDRMGVVHHSNYARILEECRIDMMRYYGLPYDELEKMGYMIPVLDLTEKFIESLRFGDTIRVVPEIGKVSAYKFYINYKIYAVGDSAVKHTATTGHCFLNNDFKPVSMIKESPDIYDKLLLMKNPENYD